MAKYAKIDIDRIRAMQRVTFATSLDLRLMQPVLDVAVRYHLLERSFDAADLIVRIG